MRLPYFIIIGFALCMVSCGYQPLYQVNEEGEGIYYEETIKFDDIPKQDIYEQTKTFLDNNNFKIRYEDSTNEIHATGGKFGTKHRKWFLIFWNTKYYNCFYDVKFKIDKGKIRYKANNFYLRESATDVGKIEVNKLYKKGHTNKNNLLFPDIDENMRLFEKDLTKTIKAKYDEW